MSDQLYAMATLPDQEEEGERRSHYYYKTYFVGGDEVVSLAESRELVSRGGATGLRTWGAATAMLDWLGRNPSALGTAKGARDTCFRARVVNRFRLLSLIVHFFERLALNMNDYGER